MTNNNAGPRADDEMILLRQAALRFFTCGRTISIPLGAAKHCKNPEIAVLSDRELELEEGIRDMFTWKPSPSIWVVLVKSSTYATTILLEDEAATTMRPYRMSPSTSLSPCCPIGSCFLGQAFVDNISSSSPSPVPEPKIMVFDVMKIGSHVVAESPPSERYRLLREDCKSYVENGSVRVQWVGDRGPAQSFCGLSAQGNSSSSSSSIAKNVAKLPHRVEGIIRLPR